MPEVVMLNLKELKDTKYFDIFSEMLLNWRNKLSKYHGEGKKISKKEHKKYIDRFLEEDIERIEFCVLPLSRVTLKIIRGNEVELGIDANPEMLNVGIGKMTLSILRKIISNTKMSVFLWVNKDNPRAIKCYEKSGFKIMGERNKNGKVQFKMLLSKKK